MGCGGERASEGPWARRAYERRWRSAKVQSRRQICWLVGVETGQVPGMLIVPIGVSCPRFRSMAKKKKKKKSVLCVRLDIDVSDEL